MTRKLVSLLKEFKKEAIGLAILCAAKVLTRKSHEPKRFLIPAYTGLGNFILKTPFIRELHKLYPNAQIDLLCGNAFGTEFVLKESHWISETLLFPIHASFWQQFRFYWKLRRKRYDVIFLFFDTAHVRHLYYGSVIAGIARRIGHYYPIRPVHALERNVLTDFIAAKPHRHEVDLNFDLLEALNEKVSRSYEQVISLAGSLSPALTELMQKYEASAGKYLVIQLTAANGQKTPKIWPASHFQILITELLKKRLKIIVLGDRTERQINDEILSPFGDQVLNLVGLTSINEAALLIRESKGLLCHDSGLMHIGNALGIPLVALIGPTDYDKNKPLAPSSHVMRLNLPCMPCLGFESMLSEEEAVERCSIKIRCMSSLTPESVMLKLAEVCGI